MYSLGMTLLDMMTLEPCSTSSVSVADKLILMHSNEIYTTHLKEMVGGMVEEGQLQRPTLSHLLEQCKDRRNIGGMI